MGSIGGAEALRMSILPKSGKKRACLAEGTECAKKNLKT